MKDIPTSLLVAGAVLLGSLVVALRAARRKPRISPFQFNLGRFNQ